MPRTEENARYETRQKALGYVRGPRITGEAAERLRRLAFAYRKTPSEVVSELLLAQPLSVAILDPQGFQAREGLSDSEMRAMHRTGN